MKLLIKNRVRIFLIRSSSSAVCQLNKKRENGIMVVFKKKEIKDFIIIVLYLPVRVYLLYQSVSF